MILHFTLTFFISVSFGLINLMIYKKTLKTAPYAFAKKRLDPR